MNENSSIVRLRQPGDIDDPLTNILRSGVRKLLAEAIEQEAEAFLAGMKELKLADGRDRVVRHGHGPTRTIQTGIGAVEVARVKIRDRGAAGDGERIRFSSAILPLWARRTRSLDALLPVLYLRGISTGEVYLAPSRASAEVAIDVFAEKYAAKHGKAVECLTKDREALLAFFDAPAEHWDHLRTTNPIESVFATVRHRTVRTKGSL
jgi:transposase-like protein